jgi:hypothetical protein
MIKSVITDPGNGHSANVNSDVGCLYGCNSLIVSTKELYNMSNEILFFINPTYGYNMNYDFSTTSSGVSVENIHNGLDDVYWTGTAIVGTWDFSSTTQAHTGAQSIDGTSTSTNDIAELAKGSSINVNDYDNISGWIYVDSWVGTKNLEIYFWDTSLGMTVGSIVLINNYVNIYETGSWQKFSISMADFGASGSTFDAIRFRSLGNIDFYLDDLLFSASVEEGSGSNEFIIKPGKNKWLYVDTINVAVVAEYDSTMVNGTSPNIPYDSFLGVAPDIGLTYQRHQRNEITFSTITRSTLDIIQRPGGYISAVFYNGLDTFLKIENKFSAHVLLKYENDDKMVFVLSDDYSGLKIFRISVGAKSLDRRDPTIY